MAASRSREATTTPGAAAVGGPESTSSGDLGGTGGRRGGGPGSRSADFTPATGIASADGVPTAARTKAAAVGGESRPAGEPRPARAALDVSRRLPPAEGDSAQTAVERWERHLATLPVRRSRQDALRARRRRGYERAARGWGLGPVPRQSVGPVAFEDEAVRIVEIALALTPVLLQTDAYARELFIADGVRDPAELDRRVALRIARQAALTRTAAPVRFEAYIDEPVLLRPVGGLRVMAEQLRHLAAMARLPHVCVRIIPASAGGPIRLDGGLLILDFPARSTVVQLEHGRLRGTLDRAEDAAVFTAMLPALAAAAFSAAESLALLTRVAEELEDRSS
ncbi:hypothetical protein FHR81_001067 [Actinoalloteichus hoggarensis]|uniref:Uncharacterized protein n=1 Tax=Actinoalloteichus hoggarensis TaxID=1470176 RepID=A0A221VZ82_9PSEU|nr:DUF5753 domain-containing protein [Actinoalloteichus hoggarensis]ASO18804.1 hypothetical protein AHOG_05755 [Actinoalloteichus hoggarensis]MBB5920037.1 hypothetical protein [Actinoalloteichus hoggarensis]